jgi:nucleoid-associated protein EbfC
MAGMFDIMKQAQAMQAKFQEAQAELERIEVEGQSGGGLVRVTLTAKGLLKGLTLDPSLLKPDDKEMLEDLIVAAYDDARKKADRLTEERMKSLTAGLPIPPGLKLF